MVQSAALLQVLLTYITAFLFYRDATLADGVQDQSIEHGDAMGVVLVCTMHLLLAMTSGPSRAFSGSNGITLRDSLESNWMANERRSLGASRKRCWFLQNICKEKLLTNTRKANSGTRF